jgi:hypothetical protein
MSDEAIYQHYRRWCASLGIVPARRETYFNINRSQS